MKIISHPYDSLQNLGNATEEGEKKQTKKMLRATGSGEVVCSCFPELK